MIRSIEIAALEDKLAIIKTKYSSIIANYPNISANERDNIWNALVAADPTKNKSYIQWIVNKGISEWTSKNIQLFKEDLKSTMRGTLTLFSELSNKKKLRSEHSDINRFKTFTELFNAVKTYESIDLTSKSSKSKNEELEFYNKKGAKLLYNSPIVKIVRVITKAASMYFGVNTQWCTAAKKDNMFNDYASHGPIYVILHKPTNRRWQFWHSRRNQNENQFMDENDNEFNTFDFVKEPSLLEPIQSVFTKLLKINTELDDKLIPLIRLDKNNISKLKIIGNDVDSALYLVDVYKKLGIAVPKGLGLAVEATKPNATYEDKIEFIEGYTRSTIHNAINKVLNGKEKVKYITSYTGHLYLLSKLKGLSKSEALEILNYAIKNKNRYKLSDKDLNHNFIRKPYIRLNPGRFEPNHIFKYLTPEIYVELSTIENLQDTVSFFLESKSNAEYTINIEEVVKLISSKLNTNSKLISLLINDIDIETVKDFENILNKSKLLNITAKSVAKVILESGITSPLVDIYLYEKYVKSPEFLYKSLDVYSVSFIEDYYEAILKSLKHMLVSTNSIKERRHVYILLKFISYCIVGNNPKYDILIKLTLNILRKNRKSVEKIIASNRIELRNRISGKQIGSKLKKLGIIPYNPSTEYTTLKNIEEKFWEDEK